MNVFKFHFRSADHAQLESFKQKNHEGIAQIDINVSKCIVRIISDQHTADTLVALAHEYSIALIPYEAALRQSAVITIKGMTCQSCEITLERELQKIEGVEQVEVDATRGIARITYSHKPSEELVREAIASKGYEFTSIGKSERAGTFIQHTQRPPVVRLVGFIVLAIAIGAVLDRFQLLTPSISIGSGLSFGAVFLIGLLAASSSCIAVSGGLLLSSAAKWNERYATINGIARMQPVLFFIAGRLLAYLGFGALIGVVGKALSPSPFVTGLITIAAALFMIVMGLDMLGMAPGWLKRLLPRMPKRISHTMLKAESFHSPVTPFLLGAATFFLPCGFTQSLQLYALSTGSILTSGLLLFGFALGTAPALFALGWASTSLKGRVGTFFFQFSGVVVLLLGFWNIQNGFTAAGYPLSFPRIEWSARAADSTDPNVVFDGTAQIVRMSAGSRGYSPDRFTVRAGIPVKWIVDGTNAEGCVSVFQAPQLGIKKLLSRGDNVFEFTPREPGTYAFSCSMGMYRGRITVVPST
ncbi:MAG: sulfite exporter TauE/SafE family protein [Patescibacteria group bacterium]